MEKGSKFSLFKLCSSGTENTCCSFKYVGGIVYWFLRYNRDSLRIKSKVVDCCSEESWGYCRPWLSQCRQDGANGIPRLNAHLKWTSKHKTLQPLAASGLFSQLPKPEASLTEQEKHTHTLSLVCATSLFLVSLGIWFWLNRKWSHIIQFVRQFALITLFHAISIHVDHRFQN